MLTNINQILKECRIKPISFDEYYIYETDTGLQIYHDNNSLILKGYLCEGISIEKKFKNIHKCLKHYK